MLTPKDILQIDATVIAGVFVFFTISSIGVQPTPTQIVNEFEKVSKELTEKLNAAEKKLSELNFNLQAIQVKKNTIQVKIDEINEKPRQIQNQIDQTKQKMEGLRKNMTFAEPLEQDKISKSIDELKLVEKQLLQNLTIAQEKIGLDKQQEEIALANKREVELESIINQARNERDLLNENFTKAVEEFNADLKEGRASFLKKPEDWAYLTGIPFVASAIFALTSDVLERHEKIKPSAKAYLYISLIFMGTGFAFLIVIFYSIGS